MIGSPLQGGSKRRRGRARLALLLGVLLTTAAALIALTGGRSEEGDEPARAESQRPTELTESGPEPTAPGIELGGVDSIAVSFRRPPRAGLVFDLDTGEVLWRRQPVKRLPIASLTKIMTALLVAERTKPRERVLITRAALRYTGSGVGVLKRGRRVPIDGLMHGLLLPSGNDAAIALAVHVSGSERRFVRLMNRRARRLGLRCTRFASSHGLENGNRSCVADLAALSRLAMEKPRIAAVVRKRSASVPFPTKGGSLYVNSTNPLLKARYPGTIGLKTGYTKRAGKCLAAVVRRGRRTLGVVLVGSPNPARQARRLLARAPAAG
jgi:serine-type D-Ala-D-Ala carboxypeptidase (penicillin-binding protein 5/6)